MKPSSIYLLIAVTVWAGCTRNRPTSTNIADTSKPIIAHRDSLPTVPTVAYRETSSTTPNRDTFHLFSVPTLLRYDTLKPSSIIRLGEGEEPRISPDGRSIAFLANGSIMRYDLETKRTSLILTKRDPLNPSWSPDGLRLVFCTNGQPAETGQGLIWIVNADGSDVHRLMPDLNGSGMCPVWSTGGREIVWTHGKDLWIADTNGQNAHQVYAETAHSFEVAWDWSPDGRTILFSVNDDPRGGSYYRLFFVGKDGTGKRPHPVEIDAGVGACWSRDGARVYNVYGQSIQVFSTLDPKPIREYIVPNKFGVPSTLSLAPDESFVVFSNETANQGDVWMFLMRL